MAKQNKKKEDEYNKLVATCLKIIKEKEILFVTDLVAFLPFTRKTFYDHELHKSDTLKEAIENNKINTKHELRKDWKTNKAPVLQIALYKLIGTAEERQALNGQGNQSEENANLNKNLEALTKAIDESKKEYGNIQ